MIRRRIWLGIGASVLTSASTIAVSGALCHGTHGTHGTGVQLPGTSAPAYAQIARAGGEGGEGGEGGASDVGTDEFYAFALLIMLGHLRIGHELAEQGHWDAAYPHFLHPIPEGYDPIEKDLARRGVAPFEDDLKALAQRVLKHDAKGMEADYRRLLATIDAAAARVDPAKRNSPAYVATVTTRLMRKAAAEYAESIENGRITEVHEYQDARGFLLEAGDYLNHFLAAARVANRAPFDEIERARVEALRAMPTAVPPKAPLIDAGTVSAAVSRAELAASGIR